MTVTLQPFSGLITTAACQSMVIGSYHSLTQHISTILRGKFGRCASGLAAVIRSRALGRENSLRTFSNGQRFEVLINGLTDQWSSQGKTGRSSWICARPTAM